ncbi:MAG: hypothetical protein BWY52_02195 [Chloroflexi bacterium ADurb.Bin325]|nr:MAG: hypothetical protein BWY52_02195 [Chloroflexi bacterium ADurb.Bin325]
MLATWPEPMAHCGQMYVAASGPERCEVENMK